MSTTYIKATLVFKIPKDRLTPKERAEFDEQFRDLQKELTETSPSGVIATLNVEEATE